MLGMGMGLNKSMTQRNREALARSAGAVFYMDARKATGTAPGINSPLTNPVKDLSGNVNDATLVNFAGTTSSGYATRVVPNGNTMPFIKPDGTDDYCSMVNTSSMDITGTEDFAICGLFMTGATLQASYAFAKCLNNIASTTQFALYIDSTGFVNGYIGGLTISSMASVGSIQANTPYEYRLKRIGGRINFVLNSIETYNQANATSLSTQPNLRLFARASNDGGTTHVGFNKDYHAYLLVARGSKCTEENINKFCELAKKGYV